MSTSACAHAASMNDATPFAPSTSTSWPSHRCANVRNTCHARVVQLPRHQCAVLRHAADLEEDGSCADECATRADTGKGAAAATDGWSGRANGAAPFSLSHRDAGSSAVRPHQRVQTRITWIGKRIHLKLSISIRHRFGAAVYLLAPRRS